MFGQFFVLFAMIAVGYYTNQKNIITSTVNTGLGALVTKFTCPALLFVTISENSIDAAKLKLFFLLVAAQFLASFLGGRLMRLYSRLRGWEKKYRNVLEITTATCNNGFVGLPVVLLFYGEEAGLYMSAGFFGIHLYLWTYAVRVLGKAGNQKTTFAETMRKMLNPNCIMVFVGLAFSLLHLTERVPVCLMDAMSMLGNMSTPLSLIYIGAMAGNEGFRRLLQKKAAVELSVVKMISFPLAAAVLLYFIPTAAMVKAVCLISMACPCAAIMPMVVEQYGDGTGVKESADITLLTTFLSMAVLPFSVWLSGVIF